MNKTGTATPEAGMVTHTIELDGRNPDKVKIRRAEADEMARKGFRFSIFDPGLEEFRLTIPYQTARTAEAHTLTFMQP
jgi:hypothetical protein